MSLERFLPAAPSGHAGLLILGVVVVVVVVVLLLVVVGDQEFLGSFLCISFQYAKRAKNHIHISRPLLSTSRH